MAIQTTSDQPDDQGQILSFPTAGADQADEPTKADHLLGLNVGAQCTAEMSLSMIVGRVKDAAFDAHLDASDEEIRAEADRILASFGENRTGPAEHQYDVDRDGTIRDWRRPDPPQDGQGSIDGITVTEIPVANGDAQVGDPVLIDGRRGTVAQFLFRPARTGKRNRQPGGWDIIVSFPEGEPKESKLSADKVHLVLDEITREPRLPKSQETTTYGVPTDASFGDDDVKPAPDLARMGLNLIQETDDFAWARSIGERVVFFWAKRGGSTGGQPKLYAVRFPTKHEKRTNGWRVVITFSADVLRDLLLEQGDIEALVHESLCQIDRDEHGNLRKLAPDFKGYTTNVERFGATVPSVKAAAQALQIEVKDVRTMRLPLDGADEPETVDTGEDLGVR